MSTHIIAEFSGVEKEKLEKLSAVRAIMNKVVQGANLHVISSRYHQFKPSGVSFIYLIQESHVSAHTWPEYNYVAVDVFTCGNEGDAERAFEILKQEFQPEKIRKKVIKLEHLKALKLS